MGSIAKADLLCQKLALNAALNKPTSFKAVLSDATVNARDRIYIGGTIKNTRGILVANNATQLWSGSWSNPVYYTERGTISSNSIIWTGTRSDGTKALGGPASSPYQQFCADWSSSAGAVTVGNAYTKDYRALDVYNGGVPASACSNTMPFYCIGEQ